MTISFVHRFVLFEESKRLVILENPLEMLYVGPCRQFETVIKYVAKCESLIPVAFIVGFYVNLIFSRFWQHFNTLPWITKLAIMVSTFIQDPNFSSSMCAEKMVKKKEKTRLQKRTIIRYLTASLLLTLSRVSIPVKRRFRDIDEIVEKGILLEHEAEIIKNTEPYAMQPFLPVMWSASIVVKANNQGRLPNESLLIGIVEEINKFRKSLQELFLLDQICVPLVYTQVVTLSIYSYFLSGMIGRQFILEFEKPNSTKDFVIPLFTILEFIVYIGWIKVGSIPLWVDGIPL